VFTPLACRARNWRDGRNAWLAVPRGNSQYYDPGWVYSGQLIGTPREVRLLLHELMTGPLLSERLRATMLDRRALNVPLQGSSWKTAGYGRGVMMDVASPHGLCVRQTGQGPHSSAAVYHFLMRVSDMYGRGI